MVVMFVSAIIHESQGNVSITCAYFVDKLPSLSFLLFAFHSKFQSFVKDLFIGLYGGEKLEKPGLGNINK
jgi:F0F1-type ATP synthase assembly protein I